MHYKQLRNFRLDLNILASALVDLMKSAGFMAFSFITFLHDFWFFL